MKYAQRIRELREDKDLTQSDIAKLLQINQTVYSRYENDRNQMPIHHLISLCLFYNVSADYILGLPDLPYPKR